MMNDTTAAAKMTIESPSHQPTQISAGTSLKRSEISASQITSMETPDATGADNARKTPRECNCRGENRRRITPSLLTSRIPCQPKVLGSLLWSTPNFAWKRHTIPFTRCVYDRIVLILNVSLLSNHAAGNKSCDQSNDMNPPTIALPAL